MSPFDTPPQPPPRVRFIEPPPPPPDDGLHVFFVRRPGHDRTLIEAELTADGQLVLTHRRRSEWAQVLGCDEEAVWRDVYAAVDGRITKVRTIHGTHHPAHWVPERVEFPEDAASPSP